MFLYSIIFFSKDRRKDPNVTLYEDVTTACEQDIAAIKNDPRIRELRPLDPMLSTAYLESDPIRVIIDYVDSPPDAITPMTPTEMKCLSEDEELQTTLLLNSARQSRAFSISSISSIEDDTTCRKCNKAIFTVETESLSHIASSKDHEISKVNNSGRSCHCPKPTFREKPAGNDTTDKTTLATLCETPIREYFKYTTKNEIIGNKTNPSQVQSQNAKRNPRDKQKEAKCSWTCGSKMFSKSEKVILTYLLNVLQILLY